MPAIVGRKLLHLLPVLLAVTALTFLIASLLPGDLAIAMLGDQATPESLAAVRAKLGLDLPLWHQYLRWLWGVVHGDFGASPRTGELVMDAILGRLPTTLELVLLSQAGALLVGVPLGILCAARPNSALDRWLSGTAFGTLSLPSYMLAILLIFAFSLRLHWFPATGFVPFTTNPAANLHALALPALTLTMVQWPVLMRVLRGDMISILQEEYIAAARAKGLSSRRILLVHALKPSSLTLVTVVGYEAGALIGGTVIVEVIFALPGIGRLVFESIVARDFVMLQGTVVFISAGFVLVNFAVDLLYSVIDPRVRHG